MIYQLRVNCYFTDSDAIEDIKDKILDHWPNAQVINPGTEAQECSEIQIIENHHDEHPNNPCFQTYHKDNCPIE